MRLDYYCVTRKPS